MPATTKAIDFHAKLGIGFDADFAKNSSDRLLYQQALTRGQIYPALFKARGFSSARIRVKDYDLTNSVIPGVTLLDEIEGIVGDCNDCGLTAVVAFQGEAFKEAPTVTERDRVVEWWKTVASALKDYDCAFNLIIETTGVVRQNDAALNDLYQVCCDAIAAIDPDRVMIICPADISAPDRLLNLVIPSGHHVFCEAHFGAAGFDRAADWTPPGTVKNRKAILKRLDQMAFWSTQSGVPVWIGAILLGAYNSDPSGQVNLTYSYTIAEQIELATFVRDEAKLRGIPIALNSDDKFLDTQSGQWIELMKPVLDVFFTP